MTEQNLKKKYDGVPIEILEESAKSCNESHNKQRMQFIEILTYLDMTKRFRENPRYRTSSFSEYISDIYNLRVATYLNERYAFLKFPVQSATRGPGVITAIKRICGAEKVDIVVKHIEEADIKKTPLKREQISKIIKKYAKLPSPAKQKRVTEKSKLRNHEQLIYQMKEMRKADESKDEQINKLKASVIEWKTRALKAEEQLRLIRDSLAGVKGGAKEAVV